MSADNVIIILQTWSKHKSCGKGCIKNVEPYEIYHVFHTQAWDNFYWYEEHEPYNVGAYLLQEIKNSKRFTDREKARLYANELYSKIVFVEYGIQFVETEYYLYGD